MGKKRKYKIYQLPDGTTIETSRLDGEWWCCKVVDSNPEVRMNYAWGESEAAVLSKHAYQVDMYQMELAV